METKYSQRKEDLSLTSVSMRSANSTPLAAYLGTYCRSDPCKVCENKKYEAMKVKSRRGNEGWLLTSHIL